MDFHSAHRVKPSKRPIALTCVPSSSLNGLTTQVWADVYLGRAEHGRAGQGSWFQGVSPHVALCHRIVCMTA